MPMSSSQTFRSGRSSAEKLGFEDCSPRVVIIFVIGRYGAGPPLAVAEPGAQTFSNGSKSFPYSSSAKRSVIPAT